MQKFEYDPKSLNECSPSEKVKVLKLVKQINLLQALFQYTESLAKDFKKVSLSNIQESLEILFTCLDNLKKVERPIGFKKECSKLHNELISLKEGLQEELIQEEDLELYSLKPLQENILLKLSSAKKRFNTLFSQESKDTQFVHTEESKELIKKANEYNVTIGKASVIPIGNFDIFLAQQYFDTEVFQGYVIFKNQMVIGIKRNEEKISIQKVLENLNEGSNANYMLISNKPYLSKETGFNISWYWVIPEKDVKKFAHLFKQSSNNISFNSWGISI